MQHTPKRLREIPSPLAHLMAHAAQGIRALIEMCNAHGLQVLLCFASALNCGRNIQLAAQPSNVNLCFCIIPIPTLSWKYSEGHRQLSFLYKILCIEPPGCRLSSSTPFGIIHSLSAGGVKFWRAPDFRYDPMQARPPAWVEAAESGVQSTPGLEQLPQHATVP